jgi:hypothetical protein
MNYRYRVSYWNTDTNSVGGVFVDRETEIDEKASMEEVCEAVRTLEVRIASIHGVSELLIEVIDYRLVGEVPKV